MFSILLLLAIIYITYRVAPREKPEHAQVHGAGQIGLLAAVALFGVDYFTSYFYASEEMLSALHPYGLQKYGYIAVGVIAVWLAAYVVALELKAKQGIFEIAVRYAFSGFAALAPVMIAALFWKRSTKWGALAATVFTGACLIFFAVLQNSGHPGDVFWQIGR